uniref:preprotein translocase subunit SecY n=1 Tax=Glaucosphaera vacuolata TaxID=38265 RepID=UPI001FCCC686|nr:preprotein translocase subunit SecY [Glaucosphaera vacuolata]UNJ18721.1 preprotein translocase subunit SecY [Glaucosphaera vacuolata]
MNKELNRRIFFTIQILILARLGIFIPIVGINHDSFYRSVDPVSLFNLLNVFSGGGLSTIGVFALGIAPYINSSIIVQLCTKVFPKLEDWQTNEGEIGRQKLTQLIRFLTLGWSIIQSLVVAFWIRPYVFNWNIVYVINTVFSLTAGSMIILWLGEMITQKGIGNGTSMLVCQNIIAAMPLQIYNSVQSSDTVFMWMKILITVLLFFIIIIFSIFLQEGTHRVPIISIKQLSLSINSININYIPLKLNHGNIMPIIFASGTIAILGNVLQFILGEKLKRFPSHTTSYLYLIFYCIFIILFSYFYSLLTRNPKDISKTLKAQGVSVIGIKPGEVTTKYLEKILNKLIFLGAVFLFLLAIIPYVTSLITQIDAFKGFGVTSLMILVGATIDISKQLRTYEISKTYDDMINKNEQ